MTLNDFKTAGLLKVDKFHKHFHIDFEQQPRFFECGHIIEDILKNEDKLNEVLSKYGDIQVVDMYGYDDGLTFILEGAK